MKLTIVTLIFVTVAGAAGVVMAQGSTAANSAFLQQLPAHFMSSQSGSRYVSYVEVAAHPAIAKAMAAATRHYYEALVEAGFSKDGALRIVSNSPSPLPAGCE